MTTEIIIGIVATVLIAGGLTFLAFKKPSLKNTVEDDFEKAYTDVKADIKKFEPAPKVVTKSVTPVAPVVSPLKSVTTQAPQPIKAVIPEVKK